MEEKNIFEYPYDGAAIMAKRKKLRREMLEDGSSRIRIFRWIRFQAGPTTRGMSGESVWRFTISRTGSYGG